MTEQSCEPYITVLNTGVDWLTCTALTRKSSERLRALAEPALKRERRAGNDLKPWGMSGFDGFKCGQIQVGTRGVDTIVRLTGGYAASNWRRFYAVADNVSRIDLQVTVDTESQASAIVNRHYKQAARARRRNKRLPTVWSYRSADGPATLYLGRRVSMQFARVYDKCSQEAGKWPQGAVRYELQCNGKQANIDARKLYQAKQESPAIRARLLQYFRTRGLDCTWPATSPDNYSCPRRRTDRERKLLWLATSVSPSVKLLVSAGMLQEVITALGLRVSRAGTVSQLRVAKAS